MFAHPRPKKSTLPPLPSKKRKASHSVAEIAFDNDARAEYLTGFHKRKVQRQKHAQEEAAKKEREERIQIRKKMREDRQKTLEEHVQAVNDILKESQGISKEDESEENDEWDGIADDAPPEPVDHEQEYIEEDLYTTVTIEPVTVDRDGLHRPDEDDESDESNRETQTQEDPASEKRKKHGLKTKKKKFRYESKTERRLSQRKQKPKR